MVLKLYGWTRSVATRRAACILKEKNVPFQFINIDITKGEHKAADYLAKQPFGQVPYIEDDGFTLFESRAISRYVAEKYATQGTLNLLPSKDASLKEKALFEQAASIELASFEPHALDVVLEKFFAQTPDEDRISKLLTTITSKLAVYDKILGNQKYLAGEHVTLADLWHLPLGFMLENAGYTVMSDEGRPNVARWWKDISSRPAWKAVENGV